MSLSLDDSSLTGIKSIHGLLTTSKKTCVYVLPHRVGKDASLDFKNWKKPLKLTKHSQSENHVSCMTKWLQFKAMERKNSNCSAATKQCT